MVQKYSLGSLYQPESEQTQEEAGGAWDVSIATLLDPGLEKNELAASN